MARHPKKEEKKSLVWLISFTDVMALMLTFFVMLFSISEPKKDTWSEIVTAIGSEFNEEYGGMKNAGIHANDDINRLKLNRGLDLGYLEALLDKILNENPLLKDVRIVKYPDRIMVSLPSDLLFLPGRAVVKPKGKKAVQALAQTLRYIKNKIKIEGHTDPDPIKFGEYPSNWGLSLARASSVSGLLRGAGYKKEIIIQGFADKDYETLPITIKKKTRYEMARRVDIVVLKFEDRGVWRF